MSGGISPPWTWEPARLLLDGYGNVLHFPAGNYAGHMRSDTSQLILNLALYTFNARDVFTKVKKDKSIKNLSSSQRKLHHRIMKWERKNGI